MADNIVEFGLDDAGTVKNAGIEPWKQQRPGEISRVSVISFKTFADCYFAQKRKETGKDLSDDEKRELIKKIDAKLATQLNKPVDQLTQADRLELKQPKFAYSFTHYRDGIGTIKCLSKYEGITLAKPEICCEKMGDADQTVGMVIMTYPVDRDGQIDEDLLLQKKYTNFHVWKMSPKKFKNFESAYKDARRDGRFTVDLKVTLDNGDVKFQKQHIEAGGNATWAKERMVEAGIKAWVLDQGLRAWKYVQDNLGYSMSRDKLVERLAGGAPGGGSPQMAAGSGEAPKLNAVNYDELAD